MTGIDTIWQRGTERKPQVCGYTALITVMADGNVTITSQKTDLAVIDKG
jgi:hypothetical protein